MTTAEVADYLQLSTQQVRLCELDDEHPLPVHRIGKGSRTHKRYYRDEVDEWLRNKWSDNQAAGGAGR